MFASAVDVFSGAQPLRAEDLNEVRHAVVELLSAIPRVDAASLRVEGGRVHVRVVAAEHDVDATDAVADAEQALAERFPGLRFDLSVTAHQGRGPSRALPRGEEPVYLRAP